jgi:serine/threonine protein kinase/tetratricopeptide (TPR) repeat protein
MNLPQIPSHEFEELIGEGGAGSTFRCRFHGGARRAVKVFNGMAVNQSLLNHALSTVGASDPHPNLAPVHAFNLGHPPFYYITDFYGDAQNRPATLDQVAGKLPPPAAWRLVEQLIDALAYLHRQDVIHSCVKPGNIFLETGEGGQLNLRLADFGQGLVSGIHYFEIGDTCYFGAPEQLRDRDFSHGKGKRWDVYSFGVVAYFLLNGHLPRLDSRYRDYLRRKRNPRHPTAALQQDDPVDFSVAVFEEPDITWPKRPRNDYEAQLRAVIGQCLSLSESDRPVDLREVAKTFETIRHEADIALLKRQHAAQLRGKQIKVRTLLGTTGIFLLTSLLLLGAALMGFTKVATEANKVVKAEQKRQSDLRKQETIFNAKVRQEQELRVAAQSETSVRRAQATDARAFLFESQRQADRFFSAILRADEVDFPGFQDLRRENLEQASGYFGKFLQAYGKDPEFAREICRADLFLGEIRKAQGRFPEALVHFAKARDAMSGLDLPAAERPAWLRELALLERSVHEIELFRSQFAAADEALERSSARFTELLALDAASGAERELIANRMAAARLLQDRGRHPEAEAALRELGDAIAAFVADRPDDSDSQALLGEVYQRLAAAVRRHGDAKAALEFQRQAARIFATLIEANGEIEAYQYRLAMALNQQGELSGEIQPLQDAIRLLDRVVRLQPDSPLYRFELASSHGRLAEILRREGQHDQALPLNETALGLLAELLAKDPDSRAYRFALARQNVALAMSWLDTGKDKESAARFEETIGSLERLVAEDPEHAEYLLLLAQAQSHAGLARQHLEDRPRALAHYQTAKASWTAVLERFPDHAEAVETVAWLDERLERKL